MNKVAIIPARGGSKRIPRKNIKTFAGQPIIAYSINAAITSNLFDRIILSTDSEQIAEVGSSYGAEVPFMRPAELSDDFTGTAEVLIHSLNWLTENDKFYPYFCCIYPTAPFLEKEYLVKGFDILRKNNATSAFSVTSFPYPIFRALKIKANNRIKMFWPEHLHSRSNDLPDAYHDAGQFYWCDTKKFLKEKIVFSSDSVPVVLPRNLVQDIDTHEDWETAEKLYIAFKSHKPVNKDQNV
ncbi:MAG: pseudaminic acid cytidylyltransferase [Desulfobacterales bacterium]|jgi:pseudaminic acid cytidylyltransferase